MAAQMRIWSPCRDVARTTSNIKIEPFFENSDLKPLTICAKNSILAV